MLPQIELQTQHTFHAGMYARTIHLPAGTLLGGALIQIPTLLIVQGDARFYLSDSSVLDVSGYTVLPCEAGRKTVLRTSSEVWMTMLFPTQARTVDEAEREFTPEWEKLMSRKSDNDTLTVTGE